ncbi:hypothetical protein ACLMJK_006173 [Lecanora helva]
MAELLRNPWLGRTIEQELGEVLEKWHKGQTGDDVEGVETGDLSYEDDGSNLRIKSPQPRIVQIIKFMNPRDPLQVCVSDSVNRINATISEDAVQRYTNKTKRRLTDGTVGGLIQLLDFEIVATSNGPRPWRIVLFILNFKSLGANGSGAYGFPQGIESLEPLSRLIEKLKNCREQGMRSKASRLSASASMLSSQQETQPDFATQLPTQRVPARIGTHTDRASNFEGSESRTGKEDTQVPATPDVIIENGTSPKNGVGFSRSDVEQAPIANGKSLRPTTNADLMDILRQVEQENSHKGSPKEAFSSKALISKCGDPTLSPAPEMISKLPHPVTTVTMEPSDQKGLPLSLPSPSTNHDEVANKATGIEASRKPKASLGSTEKGHRIRNRDVKIAKAQEEILSREDSWIPSQPGQREPSAHIPISILETLNRSANARANLSLSYQKNFTQSSPPSESGEPHTSTFVDNRKLSLSESESDAPISSSEWPASPLRAQLPPNSSSESSELVPEQSSQNRRLSSASVESGPLQPAFNKSPVQDSPRSDNNGFKSSSVAEPPSQAADVAGSSMSRTDSPAALQSPLIKSKHHPRKDEASTVYSIPSSPTSDLDMHSPPLSHAETKVAQFPSTATQPTEPFTQVKRTPYTFSPRKSNSSTEVNSHASTSFSHSLRVQANGSASEEVDYVAQTAPSVIGLSSSDASRLGPIKKALPFKTRLSDQTYAEDEVTKTAQSNGFGQEGASADQDSTWGSEHNRSPAKPEPEPEPETRPDQLGEDSPLRSPLNFSPNHSGHEAKRKATDDEILSPNITKRRKRLNRLQAFDVADIDEERPDPKEGAKRYRQDFLDSYKNPEATSHTYHGVGRPASPSHLVDEVDSKSVEPDDLARQNEELFIGNLNNLVTDNLYSTPSIPDRSQRVKLDLEIQDLELPDAQSPPIDTEFGSKETKFDLREKPETVSTNEVAQPKILENGVFGAKPHGIRQNSADKSNINAKIIKTIQAPVRHRSIKSQAHYSSIPTLHYENRIESRAIHAVPSKSQNSVESLEIGASAPTLDGSPKQDSLHQGSRNDSLSKLPRHQYESAASAQIPMLDVSPSRPRIHSSAVQSALGADHARQTIFDRFKVAYPTYHGDRRHLIAMCKKINSLLNSGRVEHPALWDDFIVRHKTDYQQYVQHCAEEVEDPLRYEDFYRIKIEEAKCRKRLITLKTLGEVLSLGDQNLGQIEGKSRLGSSGEVQTSMLPIQAVESRKSNHQDRTLSEPRVTVDLTTDEEQDVAQHPSRMLLTPPAVTGNKRVDSKKSRRSLPWVQSPNPSTQHDRAVRGYPLKKRNERLMGMPSKRNEPALPPDASPKARVEAANSHGEEEPGGWWRDDNTPFKSFMKSYKAIRPGNGNSYAKPQSQLKQQAFAHGRKSDAGRTTKINFLKWEL